MREIVYAYRKMYNVSNHQDLDERTDITKVIGPNNTSKKFKKSKDAIFNAIWYHFLNTRENRKSLQNYVKLIRVDETFYAFFEKLESIRTNRDYFERYDDGTLDYNIPDSEVDEALQVYFENFDTWICNIIDDHKFNTNVYISWIFRYYSEYCLTPNDNSSLGEIYRFLYEDFETYADLIAWYILKKNELPETQRDILRLTYHQLQTIKNDYREDESKTLSDLAQGNHIEYLRDDHEWTIVKINTPIAAEKIAEHGTSWCTRSKTIAQKYLEQGALIAFWNYSEEFPSGKKYQLHVVTNQLMNSYDHSEDMSMLDSISWAETDPTTEELNAIWQRVVKINSSLIYFNDPRILKFEEICFKRFKYSEQSVMYYLENLQFKE